MIGLFEGRAVRQLQLAGALLKCGSALSHINRTTGRCGGTLFTLVLAAVWSSGAAYADPICDPGAVWGVRLAANAFDVNVNPPHSQSSNYNSVGNTGNCLTANSVTASIPNAMAYSAASLSTATLGGSSSGAFPNQDVASGLAELHDRLFLNIPTANSGTMTDIGVNVTMDGTEVLPAIFRETHSLKFFFGPGEVTYSVDQNTVSDPGTTSGAWVSTQILASTVLSFRFHGVIAVTGATPFVDLLNQINDNCDNGGACDFSHTSKITLELPQGASFTSASTVFLTPQASAVPEPATWSLMAGVIGALGFLRRSFVAARQRQGPRSSSRPT
jgi:hypothetical protein